MTLMLFLYTTLCAAFFALLEIQIEGSHGWSEKLPCWKIKNPFRGIIGWTHIDGYHLYFWILLPLLFHLPYFFHFPLNLKNEFSIIESLFCFLTIEDFLWFVFNPAWGIKKFFTQDIPWHPKKILFFPQNYWIVMLLWIVLEGSKWLLTSHLP